MSYLAVTAFILVVLVYPLGRVFASRERDRLLNEMTSDAATAASWSADALAAGQAPPVADRLVAYARDTGGRIVVVDRSGKAVADADGQVGADFSNRPEIAAALRGERAQGVRRSDTAGGDLVYVALPVASGFNLHGAVRITYPASTLNNRVRSNWERLGLLSGLVLVGVTGLGVLLSRSVTRPVRRLEVAAQAVAEGDLRVRVPVDDGPPELRRFAATFNETVAQLDGLLTSQQRFVADASHQLRSPLAALRLRLENLSARSTDSDNEAIAAALAETTRLSRLTEGLLSLARSAGARPAPVEVELMTAVGERVAVWEPLATESGVTIEVSGPAQVVVRSAPGALEQILDNLLDNALEVAPTGSTIRLEVRRTASEIEVHVIDAGPGLTEEQRRLAFDRFWRAPEAAPGGTGLGLAIVTQLAEAGGGSAELRAAPSGGLDAVVTLLPAANS